MSTSNPGAHKNNRGTVIWHSTFWEAFYRMSITAAMFICYLWQWLHVPHRFLSIITGIYGKEPSHLLLPDRDFWQPPFAFEISLSFHFFSFSTFLLTLFPHFYFPDIPPLQGLMDVWISQTFYCATILTGQDMQVSPLASIQCLQCEKYVNCILSHLCLGWLMKGWVFDIYAPGGDLGLCYLIKSQMFLSSSESMRRVFFSIYI